jgi:hypothetical protein
LIEDAGNLTFYGYDRVSFDIADCAQLQWHRLLHGGSHQDRYRFAGSAATTGSSLTSAGPCRARCGIVRFRFRTVLRFVEGPGLILLKTGKAQHDNHKCKNPEGAFHTDFCQTLSGAAYLIDPGFKTPIRLSPIARASCASAILYS